MRSENEHGRVHDAVPEYMALTAIWDEWTAWKCFNAAGRPRSYRARHRTLRIGPVRLCVLCETELRPRVPFFFYLPSSFGTARRRDYATLSEAYAALTLALTE